MEVLPEANFLKAGEVAFPETTPPKALQLPKLGARSLPWQTLLRRRHAIRITSLLSNVRKSLKLAQEKTKSFFGVRILLVTRGLSIYVLSIY
jgi:hypothetical protein